MLVSNCITFHWTRLETIRNDDDDDDDSTSSISFDGIDEVTVESANDHGYMIDDGDDALQFSERRVGKSIWKVGSYI